MTKNKTAIITGSTSGIGQGIAEVLAAAGCNIVLNGFGDKTEINELQNELATKNKVDVIYSDADMTKPDAIDKMIKQNLHLCVFGCEKA